MEDHIAGLGHPSGLPRAMLVGFIDAVPATAAILDSSGRIVAVNAAWHRFAAENGGVPATWVGADYLAVAEQAEDDDATMVAIGIRAVLDGRLQWFDHEYPCHSPERQRWFRCLVAPLPDGAAVLHMDISRQKLAELSAHVANRAKSDFLANLSHELRTPLNAIIGFSEMMMLEVWGRMGDDRYQSYALDIHQAGNHLLSLINEVLDLSKVEAGHFELHEEVMELSAIIRNALVLVGERARQAGVQLNLELPPLPRLRGDARVLCQVMLNLLSNAVKFTPAGGIVTTAARMTAAGWLELSVRDTGIGIAAADLARVFEPYQQIDTDWSRRHQASGTGLGLPLSRRFVELHGGRLRLDSAPGIGTEVVASFPPERVLAD